MDKRVLRACSTSRPGSSMQATIAKIPIVPVLSIMVTSKRLEIREAVHSTILREQHETDCDGTSLIQWRRRHRRSYANQFGGRIYGSPGPLRQHGPALEGCLERCFRQSAS